MIRIIYQICIFFLLATDVACVDRSQQPQVAEAKSPAAPNHNSGVQLLLSSTDDRVASGEPVVMHAILANGGDKTIKIFETTPERDIWLTVEDDSHAPVPLTRLGLRYETRKNWISIRREVIPVDPGAKREYKIFANRFYDMTLAGKYFITAKFLIGSDPSNPLTEQVPVKSNEITVEIVP